MNTFIFFINFIEGFVLSYYIASYFNLKSRRKYIITITLIYQLCMSVSNYCNSFFCMSIVLIIICLFVFIYMYESLINIETILISAIFCILLFLTKLFSLYAVSINKELTTYEIIRSGELFDISMIISNIIFITIIIIFSSVVPKDREETKSKGLSLYLLLSFMFMVIISVLISFLVIGNLKNYMVIYIIISLIIIIMIIFIIFRNRQFDYERYHNYKLELEKNKFSNKNFLKMKILSDQLDEFEHRMKYILLLVKYCIKQEDNERALSIIEEYLKKIMKFSSKVVTGNSYLDYIINEKSDEYKSEDIFIKITFSVLENEIYSDSKFCELLTGLMDIYKDNLISNDGFSIHVSQQNKYIFIELIGELSYLELPREMYEYIEHFGIKYLIDKVDNMYILKLVIELSE